MNSPPSTGDELAKHADILSSAVFSLIGVLEKIIHDLVDDLQYVVLGRILGLCTCEEASSEDRSVNMAIYPLGRFQNPRRKDSLCQLGVECL